MSLSDIDVESYEETEDGLILGVEAHSDAATCPRCGALNHHLHQNHGYLVRDLPITRYRKIRLQVNHRKFI